MVNNKDKNRNQQNRKQKKWQKGKIKPIVGSMGKIIK